MANWLKKYEQGGLVLKKKTKDNYGKKANPNDVQASVGPDFVGLGYNTKGRNYSPAWGGQFQMGGALPGAVGFTYARTAGSAPANGKYTKKTKASAQNGKKFSMEDVKRNATSKKNPSTQEMSGGPYQEMEQSLMKGADVVTDLMQLGNFIPHPVGQAIGKAGNVAGGWLDAYQAADAFDRGNYGDAAINLASVALPVALGSNTFKRNSKYLQKGQPLNFLKGKDRVNYIEPFTKVKGMTDKSLMANRALLGTLGAETVYDSKQNGGEMKFYQEGLDFKPKSISQNGSVIKDDRGQWAYPGEITEIGSNDITMQGVDYPVLGVSDTGDTQMMYPDQDYKFDGEKVTEFPMAQNGKWLNKYQDGGDISKKLKKEAEETIARRNANRPTMSQYTPKPGEQAKFDKQKLERIAEDNAPLNRMAASQGAKNMQDAIEAALIIEGGLAAGKLVSKGAKAAAKYATEQTALKNAYKLNPYAFKPNEANWYRQVGESAIDDAFSTGVVRVPREEVSPRMLQEFQEQLVRMQGSGPQAMLSGRTPASPYFMKGELFYPMGRKPIINKSGKVSKNPAGKGSSDYLIETGLPNESFQPAYVKGMGLGVPEQIGETAILKPNPTLRDIENFKFYKQHWLKGYKEVPKPTSTSRRLTNKEIQEYNQKLYLDRRKGLGNQGPTDAPPEGLMPFESPEYKQGGWLNKYK